MAQRSINTHLRLAVLRWERGSWRWPCILWQQTTQAHIKQVLASLTAASPGDEQIWGPNSKVHGTDSCVKTNFNDAETFGSWGPAGLPNPRKRTFSEVEIVDLLRSSQVWFEPDFPFILWDVCLLVAFGFRLDPASQFALKRPYLGQAWIFTLSTRERLRKI